MDIYNNDACNFDIESHFDLALELTKIWANTQNTTETVVEAYKFIKKSLEEEN